jgi:nitrite reductase/ring-hydroxylating ferredoxin subunit
MTTPEEPQHWYDVPNAPERGTALCQLDTLPDGSATMLEVPAADGKNSALPPYRVLLLRSGNTVKGYVNRCAHFGVPLANRQALLIYQPHVSISCNVHYARYRWDDGYCESGDCEGASLLAIPLVVDASGLICIAQSP